MPNDFVEKVPCVAGGFDERVLPDKELTLTVPLHENPVVIDYLTVCTFKGFEIKAEADKIVFTTEDNTLITLLRHSRIVKDEDHDHVELNVMALLPKRSQLKKAARDHRWQYEPEIVDMSEALNTINAFSDPAVKQRMENGQVHYNDMPVLFPRGAEVIASTGSGLLGGIVESCSEVSTMFGNYYAVVLSVVLPTSKGCCIGKVTHKVYDFDGSVMAIDKLGIQPITDDQKMMLVNRGREFRHFTKEPTPATYTGKLTVPGWFRDKVSGASGRIMVDSINFAQIDADRYYDIMRSFEIDEEAKTGIVKDEDLWRCYNRVHGFSMRLKQWGWLDVEGIKAVKWYDNAFNQLVLSEQHKRSVLHLVKHYGTSFSDFIEGKSGGLVFLLHGPTGTGKTLTAEAVAETLHRPLYSVSVGELGTSPDQLEEKLRSILDLAFQWNAVLLLDEADIFMEARDTNNIERNAMVSIFLRLLEYYSGVLFLTTNRVQTFDPAFFSRISLAISYPRLEGHDRESVWRNVLLGSGVATEKDFVGAGTIVGSIAGIGRAPGAMPRFNLSQLAEFEVNGRNIKTAVRIAQTMAVGENREVNQTDITTILAMTAKFNKEVKI